MAGAVIPPQLPLFLFRWNVIADRVMRDPVGCLQIKWEALSQIKI